MNSTEAKALCLKMITDGNPPSIFAPRPGDIHPPGIVLSFIGYTKTYELTIETFRSVLAVEECVRSENPWLQLASI